MVTPLFFIPSPFFPAKRFLKIHIVLILFILLCAIPGKASCGASVMNITVSRVIDGDTIVLEGGKRVRYAGIDTPEFGEPFYREAKKRNASLVRGKKVKFVACMEKPLDKYGRFLGWVYVDGTDVSAVLLKEGLARVLAIPPCGTKKAPEYKSFRDEAKSSGRGIWGIKK